MHCPWVENISAHTHTILQAVKKLFIRLIPFYSPSTMLFVAIAFTLFAFNVVTPFTSNENLFNYYYREAGKSQPNDRSRCFNSSKQIDSLPDEAFINSDSYSKFGGNSSYGLVYVNAYDQPGCLGGVVAVSSKPLNTCLSALYHSSSAGSGGSFIYMCSYGEIFIHPFCWPILILLFSLFVLVVVWIFCRCCLYSTFHWLGVHWQHTYSN